MGGYGPSTDVRWLEGPFGFKLANAELYPEPIPYKGMLGFFEVEL